MAITTGYLVRSSGAGDCSPLIGRLHVSLGQHPPHLGSGSDHAMTALDMGATAAESVKMAKTRDISIGGVVRTLFMADHATTR
jgi:hypothetical protein